MIHYWPSNATSSLGKSLSICMKTCLSCKIWSLVSEQENTQNMKKTFTKSTLIYDIIRVTVIWHKITINTSTWIHTILRSFMTLIKTTQTPLITKHITLTFINNHTHPHTSIKNKSMIQSKKSEKKEAIKKFIHSSLTSIIFQWAFDLMDENDSFRKHSIYKVNFFLLLK